MAPILDVSRDRRSSQSLPDAVADWLLDQIVNREIAPEQALPSEAELAVACGVSRLTVREAVKGLVHLGVVEVRRGNGTFVLDAEHWSALDPRLLAARVRAEGPRDGVRLLLEARRVVERGAAELAARRRLGRDLAAMSASLEQMERADQPESFAIADLAFHDAVLVAAQNPYLRSLMSPLEELLREHRVLTSSASLARNHAIAAHRAVLEAIRAKDVERAGEAMVDHLDQTITDVLRFGLAVNGRSNATGSSGVTRGVTDR
jgi:DNA-binding FadR family transcriptional regulator